VDANHLKNRTKAFSLEVLKFIELLPKSTGGRAIGNQLVRSGTSVGANYRAVCRSRSKAEFIARIGVVEEEADESAFWLELILEGDLGPKDQATPLLKEANELVAIMAASRKSAKGGR
jgi:four helix bundle protein